MEYWICKASAGIPGMVSGEWPRYETQKNWWDISHGKLFNMVKSPEIRCVSQMALRPGEGSGNHSEMTLFQVSEIWSIHPDWLVGSAKTLGLFAAAQKMAVQGGGHE